MSTPIRQLQSLLKRELGRVVVGTESTVDALVIAAQGQLGDQRPRDFFSL